MKELTIQDVETIVHRDETRVMEAKETTGELVKGMQSGCAFLNTDGGCSNNWRPLWTSAASTCSSQATRMTSTVRTS